MAPLPLDIISGLLNRPEIANSRRYGADYKIHVSDLIKAESSREFCPREFVLSTLDPVPHTGRGLTPAQSLLFTLGHAVHNHVRDIWLSRSPYAPYAWGMWTCNCKKTAFEGTKVDCGKKRCPICKSYLANYEEIGFHDKKLGVTGHPDLLIKWGDYFYLYEIKSISQKDTVFEDIKEPLGNHTIQGSMYYYLGRRLGYKIHKQIRYLYVDRDPGKLFRGTIYKEFAVPVSPVTRMDPFMGKAKLCRQGIAARTLPDRICSSHSCPRAKNCNRVVTCFGLKNKI